MSFYSGGAANSGNWYSGYRCNGCGSWVTQGTLHSCVRYNTYPPAPSLQPVINIQPGISEERVRELIREALDEFRADELKRKSRNGE